MLPLNPSPISGEKELSKVAHFLLPKNCMENEVKFEA